MLDAMADVLPENFLFEAPQRGAGRRDLRHDVDAVAIVLDHAGEAANLSFDPVEALQG